MSKSYNKIFILPCEYCIVEEQTLIMTLLGSCIAICLWDRTKRIAGMNHFQLPLAPRNETANTRYGNIATELLIKSMLGIGCLLNNIEAQVFGGSSILNHSDLCKLKIGQLNIDMAFDVLAKHSVRIVKKNIGGNFGRRICFNSLSGIVTVSNMKASF